MAGGGGSGAAGPSEASAAAAVPDEYICPITAEIMTDPVSTLDGFTYERAAITEWLRTKDTSPKTGAKLESKALFPNHSLRIVIRRFTETLAAATPPWCPDRGESAVADPPSGGSAGAPPPAATAVPGPAEGLEGACATPPSTSPLRARGRNISPAAW